MKNESRTILLGTLFILLFGIVSNFVINKNSFALSAETAQVSGSWACTAEPKICPDGSAVGRTPPYCQFAPCKN